MIAPTLPTPRLVVRAWQDADKPAYAALNADPEVMAHFPSTLTAEQSNEMVDRLVHLWTEHGFGGWAVSPLEAPERIVGYAGLSWRDYAGTMRVNLGFRFAFEAWGRGYATEIGLGALEAAFDVLALPEVRALARPANLASQRVLRKIGMTEIGTLDDVPGEAPSRLYRAVSLAGGGSGLQT